MKPFPQKYAMGSNWLAGPVCCDSLNHLVHVQKCHAPHLPENISEEDSAEPVQARLLQDVSEWYVSLFVVVSYF